MRGSTLAAVIALAAIGAPVDLAAQVYSDSEGGRYSLTCTRDGYTLSPRAGRPAKEGGRAKTAENVYYLGRSCDAFNARYGKGRWCWANGGFAAEFPGYRLGFPRQELRCAPPQDHEGDCRC